MASPLLHICHAPADHSWVFGRMLPELGLKEGEFRTRADDALGAVQLTEIADAVEQCAYTVIVFSEAARWHDLTRFGGALAGALSLQTGLSRIIPIDRCGGLPLELRARMGLDCTTEEQTERELPRLRKLLARENPVAGA